MYFFIYLSFILIYLIYFIISFLHISGSMLDRAVCTCSVGSTAPCVRAGVLAPATIFRLFEQAANMFQMFEPMNMFQVLWCD